MPTQNLFQSTLGGIELRLIAIVTVDHAEVKGDDFEKLLKTGAGQFSHWIVVLRSTLPAPLADCRHLLEKYGLESDSTVVTSEPCGISRARNLALAAYHASSVEPQSDVLCFPDDDCYFYPGFGAQVRQRFAVDNPELVIMPYAPELLQIDRERWPLEVTKMGPAALMQITSSAGIFIKGSSISRLGGFDEQLGVGAALPAAEDVDFVLRAFRCALDIRYWPDLAVLHPYKSNVPSRQLGNFALVHRHRDILPPAAQARALARVVLQMKGLERIRALGKALEIRLEGAEPSPSAPRSRRSVAGLQVDTVSPLILIERASDFIVAGRNGPRTVLAGHITALNHASDPDFRRAFNKADIAMVDGISFSLISWLTPGPRLQKLATTDFAPAVFTEAARRLQRPVRVGIIGGEDHIAEAAGSELDALPDVEVVYATHGYWDDFSRPIAELNERKPDILILGLGMPLEAKWLQRHESKLDTALVITCGGWLRLVAKAEKRAPVVMQVLHLEWLWRLLTDWRRTAPRYSKGLITVVKAVSTPWSL